MIAFKNRKVDRKRAVQVYRNLHDRSGKRRWSIRQNGLIVAHAARFCLRDVHFVVSNAGMKRARKLGHRVVCAYARGTLTSSCMGTDAQGILPVRISFVYDQGFIGTVGPTKYKIKEASAAIFNQHGATAAYTA